MTDADGGRAAILCNRLIETELEMHMVRAVEQVNAKIMALEEELQRSPGNKELAQKRLDLELEAHSHKNDIRALEPCRVKGDSAW